MQIRGDPQIKWVFRGEKGELGLEMPLDFEIVISNSVILEYKKYSWNMTGFKTTPGISRPLMSIAM